MRVFLAHHADAVGPDVDPRRPLSAPGAASMEQVGRVAAARGARPDVFWHSGKLRAKQTAEILWRACNPLATLSATRDLQPGDPPMWIRDRLRAEPRDLLLAGHYPHLPRLLELLLDDPAAEFPQHGMVALSTSDEGETWTEEWRIEAP